MSILYEVQHAKYVYFGFDPSLATPSDIWKAVPILMKSDDAVSWNYIAYLPQLGNLRDGDITLVDDYYYLWGTLALYKTKDFINFTQIPVDILNNSNYTDIWAPEMFLDKQGAFHIIYTATKDNSRLTFVADFDQKTDTISNAYQSVVLPTSSGIDPTLHIVNGKYYLQTSSSPDAKVFVSESSYLDGYSLLSTNIIGGATSWYEAPEWLIDNNTIYMYQDKITGYQPGIDDSGYMVYRTANISDLGTWSGENRVLSGTNMRHGSFLIN